MLKNTNKTKKQDKFWSENRYFTEKCQTILIKFKIRILKLLPKLSTNKHIRIWHHFFIKKYQWLNKKRILMTFKIETSQFYDQSEPKQWKWNKITHFSKEHVQIWNRLALVAKCEIILMIFIVSILQFHNKSEQKQVKWNKIKRDMCKSDKILSYLQIITVFQWLLKFISW